MVAMSVWPTDGADGSVANEARWRKMARWWTPSGVVGNLAPTLAFPNLTIQPGAAWVDGHYTELASAQVLNVTANGLAVIRFDPAANSAELLWRDGATTPTQNPEGTWELPIAKTVGSVLTDLRVSVTSMTTPVPLWTTGGPVSVATNSNQFFTSGPYTVTVPAIVVVAIDARATPATAQTGGQLVEFTFEKAALGPAVESANSAFVAKYGSPTPSTLPTQGSLRAHFRMNTPGSFYYGLRATVGTGGFPMLIEWSGSIFIQPI